MRKLLIVLAVLVVLFVLVDRIAAYVAQRKVADRVATAYSLSGVPAVTIQGFPFLTQVVAGNYQQVDVVLESLLQGGVRLRNLRARFDGVHAPLGQLLSSGASTGGGSGTIAAAGSITADHASATALIPFATVQRLLPAGITLGPDGGKLKLTGRLGYQGLQVPVSAAVTVRVTQSAIELTPRDLSVAGRLPMPIPPTLLGSRLAIALPIHDLPMRLKVNNVRVTPDGFEVGASAQDVSFENRG